MFQPFFMSLSAEGGFIITAFSSSLPMYCLIQATAVFFHVSGFKLEISDFLMSTFRVEMFIVCTPHPFFPVASSSVDVYIICVLLLNLCWKK